MRITVIGCGYLGTTHAACMAEMGYEVLGVETDPAKLELLSKGQAPFYEPGLEELLARNVESGRLRFTHSYAEAAQFAEVHFLCLGTPQLADSMGANLQYLESAVDTLGPLLRGPAFVVGKSTVPVGTAAALAQRLTACAQTAEEVELAWNPEFLREGFAVKDTLEPDRLIFGVSSESAERTLRKIYARTISQGTPVITTDYATAELVKGAANTFLATKISFINAVAEICEVTGADVTALADALGHDARIGRKFLNAGIGFGGGCLPKDLRAFLHRAGELGVDDVMGFIREVEGINLNRRDKMVQMATAMVTDIRSSRVAILGAAFKPHSDDIRDSPALWVAGQLQLAGAHVSVYDPKAMDNARQLFPTLRYSDSALAACAEADVVLHLTEWPEFRELKPTDLDGVVRERRMIDGRNCLDRTLWRAAGWSIRSMGRP